jgi:hypothetical protein
MPRLRAVGDGGEEDGGFLYTVCILHIILHEGNIPDTRKQEIISINFRNWHLV